MNTKRLISTLLAVCALALTVRAQNISGTYLFEHRDTCDLYMDVYEPSPGSITSYDGKEKPTILFVFGGGFIRGERSHESYLEWFRMLNDSGYRLITVDYRLGLKDVDMSFSPLKIFATARATRHAVEMAVEDVFSATSFILDNADELGVDPGNIVIAGSSAGAMTALAAEQEICNRTALASVLPEGFNYAGVMSFAGAIVSDTGKVKYRSEPCPMLLLHGTADKTVNYKKIHFGKYGIFGSSVLASLAKKKGYSYNIYRYRDHGHDIADNMQHLWREQQWFLERNVMEGQRRIVDAFVDDPSVPAWEAATLDSLY